MHLSQIYVSNKGEDNQELVSWNTKDMRFSPKASELKENDTSLYKLQLSHGDYCYGTFYLL